MRRAGGAAAMRWVAGAVIVAGGVLVPAPAWAHGGDIDLDIGGDGLNGVTLVARWAEDGHAVGPDVDFTVSATAEDGITAVGPVEVPLAGEGEGFRTVADLLSPGVWQVEVQASGSSDATFAGALEVVRTAAEQPSIEAAAAASAMALAPPDGDPVSGSATASGSAAVGGAAGEAAGAVSGGPGWLPGAAVALVVAGVLAVLARRRRTRGTQM